MGWQQRGPGMHLHVVEQLVPQAAASEHALYRFLDDALRNALRWQQSLLGRGALQDMLQQTGSPRKNMRVAVVSPCTLHAAVCPVSPPGPVHCSTGQPPLHLSQHIKGAPWARQQTLGAGWEGRGPHRLKVLEALHLHGPRAPRGVSLVQLVVEFVACHDHLPRAHTSVRPPSLLPPDVTSAHCSAISAAISGSTR